jgi:hypothetical protein
MRGPGLTDFRLDVRESGACGWIGDANEMLAGRALNLPARVARIALQRLVAMGTVEFELGCAHKLPPHHAQTCRKKYIEEFFILFADKLRLIW